MTTEQKNKKIGARLKEVLNGMSYSTLLEKASDNSDYKGTLTTGNISEIVNGKRNLPKKSAIVFSRVLDIDAGYLLGADDLTATSYENYVIGHLKQTSFREDRNRYVSILRLAGAKIENIVYDDDYHIIAYHVIKNGHRSSFTPEEMDRHLKRFYEDVCEYASRRFDTVMDLGTPEGR